MPIKINLLYFLLFLLFPGLVSAATYKIKSYHTGPAGWSLESGDYTTMHRSKLLDPTYFGPTGIVNDVQFTINNVADITAENLADADIFVAMFPYGGANITTSQAQALKDFVDRGGSLIVSVDGSTVASGNTLGSLFGSVGFGGGSTGGSTTINNTTIAPELTNGSFGTVSTLGWSSNATTQIITPGTSTKIDTFGMVSVIAPTASTGSVVFYADTDNFAYGGIHYTGDWQKLALNLFSYSAHSTHTQAVPEPFSGVLMLLSLCVFWGLKGIYNVK